MHYNHLYLYMLIKFQFINGYIIFFEMLFYKGFYLAQCYHISFVSDNGKVNSNKRFHAFVVVFKKLYQGMIFLVKAKYCLAQAFSC